MKKILVGLLVALVAQGSLLLGVYESFNQLDPQSLTRQKCQLHKDAISLFDTVKWECDFIDRYLQERDRADNYQYHNYTFDNTHIYILWRSVPLHKTPALVEHEMLLNALMYIVDEKNAKAERDHIYEVGKKIEDSCRTRVIAAQQKKETAKQQ